VKLMFTTYLVLIVAGLAYLLAVALVHR